MSRVLLLLLALIVLAIGVVAAGNLDLGPLVITREDEQKIVLFFNEARRVTQPGPSLRWPILETTETYDRRWLYLNTEPDMIQTKDGEQLTVDNYVIWRIEEAIAFKRAFPGGMRDAEKRIDRAVRDDVREVLGRHTLSDVLDAGREAVMQEIAGKTRSTTAQFGIGVADVRINRTELPEGTERSVYARMKTERERLAKKNRAEGEEQARRIRAEADRDAKVIVAEARRDAEIAKGEGDARAAAIYAAAYDSDREFYGFVRSLEAYEKTIDENTTLVLSPEAEFFRFLESANPGGGNAKPPVDAGGE